jgi:hypothetical protein
LKKEERRWRNRRGGARFAPARESKKTMPKKKIISMLEFLRTGKSAGITCGCTAEEVVSRLGPPDYESDYDYIKKLRYNSLEVWFHADTRIVYRLTFQRFRHFRKPKHSHSFQQAIPLVTRAKVDPWVLREGLGLETAKRLLKTANLEYQQSQLPFGADQLKLESGVCLLFEPADEPWLCFLEIAPKELSIEKNPSY